MEPIHTEYEVERLIPERQCTDITLHRLDMRDASATKPVFSLFQHIQTIVHTSDISLSHPPVLLRSEHCRSHRYIEHPAREIVRNPTQYPAGDLVVVYPTPEQFEIQTTPPLTLCDGIVVEMPTKPISLLYRCFVLRRTLHLIFHLLYCLLIRVQRYHKDHATRLHI